MFGILADPDSTETSLRYLRGVERDRGRTVTSCVRHLCQEKCAKLLYVEFSIMLITPFSFFLFLFFFSSDNYSLSDS